MRDNITILNESWTSELLFSSSFQKYTKLRYWINKFSCSLIKFCYIPNFPGTKCLSHFPVPPPSFAFPCVGREKKNKISIDEIVPSLHYAGEWRTWNRISLNNFLSMKTSGVCAATALCKCFMCLNNEDGLLVKRTNANTLLSLNSDVWVLIIYNVCLQFCIAGCKANVRKKTRNVQREREIERELKKEVPHIHRLTVG